MEEKKLMKSFDEKFMPVIKDMKKYLLDNHLRMISFTLTDGWRFKLNIPNKEYQKLLGKK